MYAEGTVIGGRYRLLQKVGEGGMATVWKAEHLTLGSPVAVKFLQGSSGTVAGQTNERFMREARAAAAVRHRNVIEITDFGVTDDGAPYMVLELLEGENLADRMDSVGALDPLEAARLVSLVLRGLAAVHDAGIVHRDLKPENIFLVADADGTFPKLLDFGVSRRAEARPTNLTQEGILVGTPDYMSPEQARGLRDIDQRTDIYSMGVILYEALAGRLPFVSENVGDLIVMITTQDPPPLQSLRPEVSNRLAAVVAKAMSRKREERYADAREMRWALADAMEELAGEGRGSGLQSISEFPTMSGSRPQVAAESTTEAATSTVPAEGEPAHTSGALGGPPPTSRAKSDAHESRSRPVARALGLVVLLAGLGGGGFALYDRYGTKPPEEPEPPKPEPWVPATAGLPSSVLDAGVGDGGMTVEVRVRELPAGARWRVEDVPIDGEQAALPAREAPYRLEVVVPDAGVIWRARHPGHVDGEYAIWAMGEEELAATGPIPDAGLVEGGVSDDSATDDSATADARGEARSKRRRSRRDRGRRRR